MSTHTIFLTGHGDCLENSTPTNKSSKPGRLWNWLDRYSKRRAGAVVTRLDFTDPRMVEEIQIIANRQQWQGCKD